MMNHVQIKGTKVGRKFSELKRLPKKWIPITRLIIGVIPLVFLTLLLPMGGAPFAAILTTPFLYGMTRGADFQEQLFDFDKPSAHWFLIMPLECVILGWAFLLIGLGKLPIVMSVVGVYALLLIAVILPAIRFRFSRKKAFIPYGVRFWLIGLVVIGFQIINVVRH